jgi:mRNA interferase RelE/StbE
LGYLVRFAPAAERQFRRLSGREQVRLARRIDGLSEDSRPAGSEKLSGGGEFYRIRSGDYRVIYTIRDEVLLVLVAAVGRRRDVYRRMPPPGSSPSL